MSDWVEFSARTVDEAITNALIELQTTSDNVEVEVLEKETGGLLGLFSKPAKIRVCFKQGVEEIANRFLQKLFDAMNVKATYEISLNEAEETLEININGEDMGILIGKRGQTLDSLQYLVSLVINKESDKYFKVKLDTENYRQRRKDTLENLAKNISFKVKKTRQTVSLEPMNSFERRIIHSALQNDKYVETHSEGEEPYRKVVITLKKGVKEYSYNKSYGANKYSKSGYKKDYKNSGYKKDYKKPYQSKNISSAEEQVQA